MLLHKKKIKSDFLLKKFYNSLKSFKDFTKLCCITKKEFTNHLFCQIYKQYAVKL